MAFSFWLAWNVTTRRAVIGISSPVLGLRPGRCGFSRSWKLPKPDSLTLSPCFERDADLLEEALDHVLGFALVEPELLEQQVGQFGFGERHRGMPCPWSRAWRRSVSLQRRPRTHVPPSRRVDVRVRQSTCSILHKHQNRKAFPAGRQPVAAVDVEQRRSRRRTAAWQLSQRLENVGRAARLRRRRRRGRGARPAVRDTACARRAAAAPAAARASTSKTTGAAAARSGGRGADAARRCQPDGAPSTRTAPQRPGMQRRMRRARRWRATRRGAALRGRP